MIIGLTGSLGSGEIGCIEMLRELAGAPIIDADAIAHQVQAPGGSAYGGIVDAFGHTVLAADGIIDRKRLAALVFADPEKRELLNSLVHPRVREREMQLLELHRDEPAGRAHGSAAPGEPHAGVGGQGGRRNCGREVALSRLSARSGMTPDEIRRRLAAQMPQEEKIRRADYVIDNSGNVGENAGAGEAHAGSNTAALNRPAPVAGASTRPVYCSQQAAGPTTPRRIVPVDTEDLKKHTIAELTQMAKQLNIEGCTNLRKQDLISKSCRPARPSTGTAEGRGHERGRHPRKSCPTASASCARRITTTCPARTISTSPLPRSGASTSARATRFTGQMRVPKESERYFALLKVDTINNEPPEVAREKTIFENLTPLYPVQRIKLETEPKRFTTRVMDLMTPIGKGQRALIVAPPRSGKTVILQHIANAITANHPTRSISSVLLIDERPEEVTDMERSVKGEVISSTFDEPADRHVQVAEMVI